LSESELEKQIETLNQKKGLLISSYSDGLFNSKEYDQKLSEIESETSELNQLLTLKLTTNIVLLENKSLFDRLLELKAKGLISNDEYKFKFNELMSSLIQKREIENREAIKVEHQDINDSNKLGQEEIIKDKRKKYNLFGFALILFLTVSILLFQNLSNKSKSYSSYYIRSTGLNNSISEDKINIKKIIKKDNLNTIQIDKSNEVVNSESKNPLDRIYLGTNLFHEGYGGKWGRATISKQGDHYLIKGEHKMSDGEWVKIEGVITSPTFDGFTFQGKIASYSPSRAKLNEEYGKWEEKTNFDYPDTCVWIGKTEAYKLFKDRKYWRIKSHDCYSYTTDIDIFHN
jgi:hypothetical protein